MARYDYYANRKVSFLGKWVNGSLHESVLQLIKREAPQSLLEIGPGKGELTQLLQPLVENYCVQEPNAELQQIHRANGVEVFAGFAPPIPLEDKSLDVVLLIHVLEHVENLETAEALLKEIRRVLKPDGTFLLICPDIVDMQGFFYECDYTHQFATSLYRCKNLLEDLGFQVVHQKFLYGGDTGFWGALGNHFIKGVFSFFGPLLDVLYVKNPKILKMRMLFARAFWLENKIQKD